MDGIFSGIFIKEMSGILTQGGNSKNSVLKTAMFSAMFSAILSFPSTTVKNEEVAAIPQIPYPETPTLMVPKKIEKLTMSLEEFGRKYPELVNFLAGVDEDATFDSIIEKIFNTLEGNRAFFNDPKRALEYEKQYRESQGYGTSKTLSGTIQNIGLIIQTLEYIKKTLLQGVGDHLNFHHSQEDCFLAINKAIQEYNRVYEKKESLINNGQRDLQEQRNHDGYNIDDVDEWINSREKAPVQQLNLYTTIISSNSKIP